MGTYIYDPSDIAGFAEYRSIKNAVCPLSGEMDELIDYLRRVCWDWHEKIDGMGMRIIWTGSERLLAGRTKISTPSDAELEALASIAPSVELLKAVFGDRKVIIFGELFGEKIQKNLLGMTGRHFRVFDILLDNKKWASLKARISIIADLGLEGAPYLLSSDLSDAEWAVRLGLQSEISPKCLAEGLVGRPREEIFDKYGNLILCKIKTKYYRK